MQGIGGGNIRASGQLITTYTAGAPLNVGTNTTKVTNLNADLFNNNNSSFYTSLANMTGGTTLPTSCIVPAACISTGILPVANGGTGINTQTGTAGSVVLSQSPTINNLTVSGKLYSTTLDTTCSVPSSCISGGIGGIKILYGRSFKETGSICTVTFESQFTTTPVVTITLEQPYNDAYITYAIRGSPTTTSFQYFANRAPGLWNGITPGMNWIAIGT